MKDDPESEVSLLEALGINLEEPAPPPSPRQWVGAAITGGIVIGCVAVQAPFFLTLAKSPLPYVVTPGDKIYKALKFVQKQKSPSAPSQRTFVDLGSGDGEGVYQAARAGYHQAVGLELNWTLYKFSQLRRKFFWEADLRQRTQFYQKDFFTYSVAKADTCLIFGVPTLMERVSRKLAQECKPGTHVLSYRFELPLADTSKPHLLAADIVYDWEEMRVYRCR